jgi:Fe-Mn family superoxide dismutase
MSSIYTLPSIPYAYEVLEPYIDKETMFLHHTKHHQAYVNKLNEGLSGLDEKYKDLVLVQRDAHSLPTLVRNNGGGHYNHSLFWKCMAPVGSSNSSPIGELKVAISDSFGSLEEMKKKFTDAASTVFGSGWAWLGFKPDGSLAITKTSNQDNPLMESRDSDNYMIPILGLDVWEHAYYLKYQNRRPEYIQQWWNVVNWDQVSEFYTNVKVYGTPVAL